MGRSSVVLRDAKIVSTGPTVLSYGKFGWEQSSLVELKREDSKVLKNAMNGGACRTPPAMRLPIHVRVCSAAHTFLIQREGGCGWLRGSEYMIFETLRMSFSFVADGCLAFFLIKQNKNESIQRTTERGRKALSLSRVT
jgi:hypothetical protein